jgi:hypothetical protein
MASEQHSVMVINDAHLDARYAHINCVELHAVMGSVIADDYDNDQYDDDDDKPMTTGLSFNAPGAGLQRTRSPTLLVCAFIVERPWCPAPATGWERCEC